MLRLGRKKKRARGARFPSSPARFLFFSIIDILMGIPSGSLCGGESCCTETCSKFLQRYLKLQTFSLTEDFVFLNALIDVEGSLFKKRPFISFIF